MTELHTTQEVIEALGGVSEIARLTGRNYAAAWMWKKARTFPSDTCLVIKSALEANGHTAPIALWRMVQP